MKNTQKSGQKRQGDVLTLPVNEIPKDLKVTKKVVLALGEATGHHHSFDGGAVGFADDENALVDYFQVTTETGVPLKHQEHNPVHHDKGTYRNVRQSEYAPEALKPVVD